MHHVIIESIIMVLAKLKIHIRTFAWLETLLALPSISDTASSNNNYCKVCFSFMDSIAVYTNKKNSKSYPSLIFRFLSEAHWRMWCLMASKINKMKKKIS